MSTVNIQTFVVGWLFHIKYGNEEISGIMIHNRIGPHSEYVLQDIQSKWQYLQCTDCSAHYDECIVCMTTIFCYLAMLHCHP